MAAPPLARRKDVGSHVLHGDVGLEVVACLVENGRYGNLDALQPIRWVDQKANSQRTIPVVNVIIIIICKKVTGLHIFF